MMDLSFIRDIIYILPELGLTLAIFLIIVFDLISGDKKGSITNSLILLAIVFYAFLVFNYGHVLNGHAFGRIIYLHPGQIFYKLLAAISTFLAFIISLQSSGRNHPIRGYGVFYLFILLGSSFLLSSGNWLMVYLSIEFISLASYILVGYRFSKESFEAAFKYLVFGAVSSGFMLFGISLILITTGNFNIHGSGALIADYFNGLNLVSLAYLLTLAGLLFKLSLVPFHFWAPDVYQGSGFALSALLSLLPKLAAFGFLQMVFISDFDPVLFSKSILSDFLAFIAILSVFWGNLGAIRQKNYLRLFAYSGISQSGFILLALLNGTNGVFSLKFYILVYVFMNIVPFAIGQYLGQANHKLKIGDLNGLGLKIPVVAVILSVSLIALIGLPPTAGFTAKFLIFVQLFEWYDLQANPFRLFVFLAAILNVVLALFYYLRIPFALFLKKESETSLAMFPKTLKSPELIISLLCSAVLILVFFYFDTLNYWLSL